MRPRFRVIQKSKTLYECTLILQKRRKKNREREAEGGREGRKERGRLLGMPVISLMAFWSSQLDNKLGITISTGIKRLV